MIIDTNTRYAIIHAGWYHVSGELMALTTRHGNAVLEAYTGTRNQLWTIYRSGIIKSASGTYLVYDRAGIVSVRTSDTPADRGFRVQPGGSHPFEVTITPQDNEAVVLRGSYASRFVNAEDPGMAGGTWFLVDAKAMAMYNAATPSVK